MSIEAMKEALEALDYAADIVYSKKDDDIIGVARKSLRQAIEEAEKQEPVAWIKVWDEKEKKHVLMNYYITPPPKREQEPFAPDWVNYRQGVIDGAAQREWVGLTEYEVHKIIDDCTPDEAEIEELIDFSIAILAVEAKLKERNT